ncbi:oligopeptide ABC transporter permease OppB [Vibrio diabolicus]|jgi:oligopeptide transport system permease protein|uniref:Oligopeptide transport system permease protein OppB n=4 Tax=Vibrio TaxID=662 RepID=A0A0T7E969_9VIBR|nr:MULTISPECIES: oligopeptide ABC transporter permease OppB [Vibrio]KOY44173.1 oligopeptide transporter permease [Vibrio parahaemolyticus]MCR9495732.1 oligopeptide ABC transporter permease OppB [Vibrio alginolyticus]MEA3481904.1 oligopeptide ABC transporter permease OppB [Pseudomonadota bacterium]AVF60660.1 oligopeptide ABC transporter permease OppB [Vibrio diabolicus]AVF95684.1 oligopeptide ABC transporter permease OppB [Vibrio diabolicus]|eukprot:NODE_2209_length_1482_cov_2.832965_g2100_i0.p1 GENE.NODE_2209_length_1482_cov_2.832965_g2100_i0~~NODE_2209_length_1482_cov_2.832965_g2100_i0.p1  ORF type:complete len:307 (-),score=0.73 NODE_2209_length_1482_cov_2.832965_g2100_i0:302-1222(-)
MLKFIAKRIFEAIPTMLVLITVSFFLMRFAPGNPFSTERPLPPEVMANIEAKYGLDKPVFEQYTTYLTNVIQGDFGPSFKYLDYSVNELIAVALPVSAKVGFIAFIFTLIMGVTVGTIAALKQNTWIDYTIMSTAMLGVVMPSFVLAPALIYLFSLHWNIFPAGGWQDGSWQYLVLPVIGMSLLYVATFARITRGSMIETLNSNFIRTARAKGLSYRYIIIKHALKPALLPVVSYMGPAFVGIITGSVVIETIFGLPGIGKLFVNAAFNRDYSLVMGVTILIGFLFILFNAIVDILLAMIDPKIRY